MHLREMPLLLFFFSGKSQIAIQAFVLCTLLILFWSPSAKAILTSAPPPLSSAKIGYISDYQEDQQLFIDANIQLTLSGEIQQALKHEVAIFFSTQVQLSEQMNFFGFHIFVERQAITYETLLRFSNFTGSYELTNLRNQQTRQFKSLKQALYTLGAIHSFPLVELARMHPSNTYQIGLRMSISPWKLPAPLIFPALTQAHWQLDSGWYEKEIRTSPSWN